MLMRFLTEVHRIDWESMRELFGGLLLDIEYRLHQATSLELEAGEQYSKSTPYAALVFVAGRSGKSRVRSAKTQTR